MDEVEVKIRKFLKERFREYQDEIRQSDKLEGVVDSMGLFELVTFLESEFSLAIPSEEFRLDLFSSIENIKKVVDEFKSA
jgi:acyl carrier protein